MNSEHTVIDTGHQAPHHSSVVDSNEPPKPVDFGDNPTGEEDLAASGEATVAAKHAAGSARVTEVDEGGEIVGDATPNIEKDVHPENEPKFESEGGGLAGDQLTPGSIKEGAEQPPENDEHRIEDEIEEYWEIDKAIIDENAKTQEELD